MESKINDIVKENLSIIASKQSFESDLNSLEKYLNERTLLARIYLNRPEGIGQEITLELINWHNEQIKKILCIC